VREQNQALQDLSDAFASKDMETRAKTLDKLTDLFVAGAESFSETHIAVFDQVISLLTDAIETRARAHLAERLADLANAPPNAIRKLSRDEIMVARPVLARSPRLTDSDLVEAARHGGRDHMLAISERRDLSEPVTDVLVSEGDRVVVNAVASNPTARFSIKGYDMLVVKSHADQLLQSALGRRSDIPRRHMSVLFELAKAAARDRLKQDTTPAAQATVSKAIDTSARAIAKEAVDRSRSYQEAAAEIAQLAESGNLNEPSIQDLCRRNKLEHVVIAISTLANLPFTMAQRAVFSADNDMLLILARSAKMGWPTVKAIFSARQEHKPGTRQLDILSENYNKLTPATAQRVMRFLHARETAVQPKG
jgi:uncharacterized protein (DUF2336 family)